MVLGNIADAKEYLHALERLKERYIIIIAFKYTTGAYLGQELSDLIKAVGFSVDLSWEGVGKRSRAFVGIIKEGVVIYEVLAHGSEPVYFRQIVQNIDMDIVSMAWAHGDCVRIGIDGEDYAINERGMNIVVYDTYSASLIDSVCLDTHSSSVPVIHKHDLLTRYQRQLDLITASGYSVPQYFYDVEVRDLVIYVDSQFIPFFETIFIQFCLFKKVRVKYVSERRRTKSCINDDLFGGLRFEDINSVIINKRDTVLIFAHGIGHTNALLGYFKNYAARVITLSETLEELMCYVFHIRPLLVFMENHPGVKVINYSPLAFPLQDCSENESLILQQKITQSNFIDGLKRGQFIVSQSAYEEHGYSPQDVLEMTVTPEQYYDENFHSRMADMASQYINVQNGHRFTPNQPEDSDYTVFMVGGCRVFGNAAPDDKTQAAYLQAFFNKEGQRVRVENYGRYSFRRRFDFGDILSSLPCKSGDIILTEALYSIDTDKYYIPNYYNFTCELPRPHTFGELFTDQFADGAGAHLTPNGNRAAADILFAFLKDRVFEEEGNASVVGERAVPKVSRTPLIFGIPMHNSQTYEKHMQLPDAELTEGGLNAYRTFLRSEGRKCFGRVGAIVMNCNPFTLGHRYLIEEAVSQVEHLFVFVVEEDRSAFPFRDRIALVKDGTADFQNVVILPSGGYIISTLTFVDYFNKSELQDRVIDPALDVELFAREIAPVLNITVRFAGEEPFDNLTRQYNETMKRILPNYGIEFVEIPRKKVAGEAISASRVRRLLEDKDYKEIAKLVPQTTLAYLKEGRAKSEK
jgi:[citrate (pro-3S)-lyase] ligase